MADRAVLEPSATICRRMRFVSEPLSFKTAIRSMHENGAGTLEALADCPFNTNAGTGRGRIGV
jgi:hypothetical protein